MEAYVFSHDVPKISDVPFGRLSAKAVAPSPPDGPAQNRDASSAISARSATPQMVTGVRVVSTAHWWRGKRGGAPGPAVKGFWPGVQTADQIISRTTI
jgi:hypothetical protein